MIVTQWVTLPCKSPANAPGYR